MKCEFDKEGCKRPSVVMQVINHNDEQRYICQHHLDIMKGYIALREWNFDDLYTLLWEDEYGNYVL